MNSNQPKHTPGPWKAITNGYPIGTASVNKSITHRIATLETSDTSNPTFEETAANAALIAAAPEMLEALKTTLNLIHEAENIARTEKNGTLISMVCVLTNNLNSVIAKAEGVTDHSDPRD